MCNEVVDIEDIIILVEHLIRLGEDSETEPALFRSIISVNLCRQVEGYILFIKVYRVFETCEKQSLLKECILTEFLDLT